MSDNPPSSNQSQQLTIGTYAGILGLILTPVLMIVAYYMEPTYQPVLQTISKLGITPNGEYVFVLSTIVGGSSLIVFHYFSYKEKALTNTTLHQARLFGIISGFGLIGVGVVQDYPDLIHQIPHWLSAFVFFLLTFLFIVYFCKFLKENNNKQNFRLTYNLAYLAEFLAISYLLTSIFTQKLTLFMIDFKLHVIWQKLTVVSYLIWYLVLFYDSNKNKTVFLLE